MKISSSKVASIAFGLFCTFAYLYFTKSEKNPPSIHQEKDFIKKTERLIEEITEENKVFSNPTTQSIAQNQTDSLPSVSLAHERSTSIQSLENHHVIDGSLQTNEPNPQWKNELEIYLNEDSSPQEFLDSLNVRNWKKARDALAVAYEEGRLRSGKSFQKKFWSKVGEIGGKEVAVELLQEGDPAFVKILEGWAKGSPQEMFDYYAELDLKSPDVQNYLEKTNSREIPLMDQFSSTVIDEILRNSDGKNRKLQVAKANDLIDHFLEKNKGKAESLTREFTERVIKGRDKETLKQWVTGYKEPELQAGSAQRVIESGAFDENPLEAVEFADSLESIRAKRSALSSAYARLAAGKNGHDPNHTAIELNAMEDGWRRDFALNGFAHGLVRRDPDAALEWANSISDEGFREIVTKNISKRIKKELVDKASVQ